MNSKLNHYIPLILIGILLWMSLWSTLYEWGRRGDIKPGRYFELVHNFPTDYNFYLSRIRQGKEGAWVATEKYTSEAHRPSLLQVFYVIIGRISEWSHVQTPYVWFSYHVARVFFGGLLLVVIWRVAAWVFAHVSWQVLAFLLAATASTWPKFERVDGWLRFGGYMPWWSVVDRMQATSFIPHVLFGQALLVFILWVFGGGFLTTRHLGNYIFLGIVGCVLGIVFPPGLLFVYVAIGIMTLWELVSGLKELRKRSFLIQYIHTKILPRGIFGIISAPTLAYFSLLFQDYPWKRLVEFDVLHPTQFSFIEYFLAVGPLFPVGVVSLFVLLWFGRKGKAPNSIIVMLGSWVLAWLGCLFVFSKIPEQSPTRFTEMMPHVPLAFLTALLGKVISEKYIPSKDRVSKIFLITLRSALCAIIFFGFGSMISSYLWQKDFVDHKLRADYPAVPHGAEVMYPLLDIIEGAIWLQVYTPRSAVVLTGITTGNYLPVYSGNTVFIGHANTVDLETKEKAVANFYVNRLGKDAEYAWVREQGIAYIFFGPEEKELAGGLADLRELYPELREVYTNNSVTIYAVPH